MMKYGIIAAGTLLAAIAIWHPAPRPPQVVASTPLTGIAAAAATESSTEHPVRGRSRHSHHRGTHRRHKTHRHKTPRKRSRRSRRPPPKAASVDVNHANAGQLASVPGIGPALAQRIVEVRESEGAFDTFDELLDVAGMSDSHLQRALPYLALRR